MKKTSLVPHTIPSTADASARSRVSLLWLVIVLSLAALVVLSPLSVPCILAAWFAMLARPLLLRVERATGGLKRAAATIVTVFLLVVAVSLAVAAISLAKGAVDLSRLVLQSGGGSAALQAIVSSTGGPPSGEKGSFDPHHIISFLNEHGGSAFRVLQIFADVSVNAVVALFLFTLGCYTFLVHGMRFYAWLVRHAPLSSNHVRRMVRAFDETGRGLIVGVGLTALVQAAVATIGYFVAGVPRALVLGFFTAVAALIPSLGTALIWVPVTLGLFLSGNIKGAVIVGVIGLLASTVDNVLRPWLSRFGELDLPFYALMLAMFGGIAVFGASGILLGPLLVRLALEALRLAREEGLTS